MQPTAKWALKIYQRSATFVLFLMDIFHFHCTVCNLKYLFLLLDLEWPDIKVKFKV